MDRLSGIVSTGAVSRCGGLWRYWRPGSDDIVELSAVHGREVALPAHFHHEDQLSFVIAGRRRFLLGGRLVEAGPGEGMIIPAHTTHRSLPSAEGVLCFNIYLPAGGYANAALLGDLARQWHAGGLLPWAALRELARGHRLAARQPQQTAAGLRPDRPRLPVAQAAILAGMSREGYSRAFRRCHGMPPQAHGLMLRLNDAKELLRTGLPIAEAAAAAGFADQSHLGRCFRHAFGVTPGRYRAGS